MTIDVQANVLPVIAVAQVTPTGVTVDNIALSFPSGPVDIQIIPTSFGGPAGPAGATGAEGPTGPEGPMGAQGAPGATGPEGPTGPTGPSGGPVGPAGPTGATGAEGPTGPPGAAGATGPTGAAGAAGARGPTGSTGATGPPGTTAASALTGATLAAGVTASSLKSLGALTGLQVGSLPNAATPTPSLIQFDPSFSNVAGANPKVELYPGYGLGVSSGQLDHISGGNHAFWSGGVLAGVINATDAAFTGSLEVEGAGFSVGGVGCLPQLAAVAVTAPNVLAALPSTCSGICILFVNGVALASVGGSPPFTVSGAALTWNAANAGYALATTDSVFAFYMH